MTKEELEKEAEDYAEENKEVDWEGFDKNKEELKQAYLASAEPREKRIEELKTTNKRISDECHKLVDTLEKKQKEVAELEKVCDKNMELADEIDELHNRCKNCALEISKGKLEDLQNENVDLLGKIAFTENALNNEKAKVAELEKENARQRLKLDALDGQTPWKDIKDKSELIKENAELQKEIRCECTRCVYSDSPCIRSDYGVEKDEDVCPNYENVFVAYTQLKKENAELDCQKNRNKFCYSCANATERCFRNEIGCPCEKYKSYKDENTELKEKWLQATDEGTSWAHRKSLERENSELKELIKNIIRVTWGEGWNYSLDWKVKAEQFLKPSEMEK